MTNNWVLFSFYKEQWYLEKRNAICMTCGRVSPLATQSNFEDLAVDFEGTTASGVERFYRRTLDKSRSCWCYVVHTVTLKQTERRKKNKMRRRCLPVSGGQRR